MVPSGPGEPVPDAAAAWAQVSSKCSGVKTYSASLHLSGRVNGERLRLGGATIVGALTDADQIRLEVIAAGRSQLFLAGSADRATLLLPRDNRVLVAPADAIVEALTGVRVRPKQLLFMLAGCVTQSGGISQPVRYGPLLAATADDARVFLREESGRWHILAGETNGLILDYGTRDENWPRRLKIDSAPGRTPAVSLSVTMDQIDVNGPPFPPGVFTLSVPASAQPMTLEELRPVGKTVIF